MSLLSSLLPFLLGHIQAAAQEMGSTQAMSIFVLKVTAGPAIAHCSSQDNAF